MSTLCGFRIVNMYAGARQAALAIEKRDVGAGRHQYELEEADGTESLQRNVAVHSRISA